MSVAARTIPLLNDDETIAVAREFHDRFLLAGDKHRVVTEVSSVQIASMAMLIARLDAELWAKRRAEREAQSREAEEVNA